MHRLQVIRLADPLPGQAARLLEKHADFAPDHRGLAGALLLGDQRLQRLQPRVGDLGGDLIGAIGGGRTRARRILEAEGRAVIHRPDQRHRVFEILVGLAGETDDEIAREHHVGPRRANPLDKAQICLGGVLAVHCLEDPVRTRLHRQMQVGHQLGLFGMGLEQVFGHVVRMRGGVADALQPVDFRQCAHQLPKAPVAALARTVIAVDVLAEQGDLAHALVDQLLRLVQHLGDRARDFRAARIGHHAEGAELVATLLHRQKRSRARRLRALRQEVELVLGREFGVDRALAALGRLDHLGQAVIILRAHHQIDQRHPAHDLGALGLRHAARDADLEIGLFILERLQPAQIGIDLFGGFLADVAGVEQYHIRLGGVVGQHIALGAHGLGHALAVIDVHLTAIGLDMQLLRRVRHSGPLCNGPPDRAKRPPPATARAWAACIQARLCPSCAPPPRPDDRSPGSRCNIRRSTISFAFTRTCWHLDQWR